MLGAFPFRICLQNSFVFTLGRSCIVHFLYSACDCDHMLVCMPTDKSNFTLNSDLKKETYLAGVNKMCIYIHQSNRATFSLCEVVCCCKALLISIKYLHCKNGSL